MWIYRNAIASFTAVYNNSAREPSVYENSNPGPQHMADWQLQPSVSCRGWKPQPGLALGWRLLFTPTVTWWPRSLVAGGSRGSVCRHQRQYHQSRESGTRYIHSWKRNILNTRLNHSRNDLMIHRRIFRPKALCGYLISICCLTDYYILLKRKTVQCTLLVN